MTAAALPGIHNENEFFSHHYLSEIFAGDVRETVERWRAAAEEAGGAGGGDAPGGPPNARCAPSRRSTSGSAARSSASGAPNGG